MVDMGKLPPQAKEIESAVLGAILQQSECLNDILEFLNPNSFYVDANNRVFNAILTLSKNYSPVDILTVTQELKKTGELDLVGGAYYVVSLTNGSTGSSVNAVFHARIIQQKFIQREIIRICSKSIENSYEDNADIVELASSLERGLLEINKNFNFGKVQNMATIWNEISLRNEKLISGKGLTGVLSGYESLDKMTGGWQNGNLIILAARPAMGKTALCINFMRNASVLNKIGVLMFSLEMGALEIGIRAFSIESDTPTYEFSRKGISPDEMVYKEKDCVKLIDSNIFIDDTGAITLQELRSKARKFKREKNIGLIVVDYLQLMSGDKSQKGNREQEISSISRGLKALAKELDLPVIALSQLSRETEKRGGDKRPQLSDLRESGAIEQDADMVIFIHRPEYYGISEYPEYIPETGDNSALGVAEIIIAKHRNGACDTIFLNWKARLTKFESFQEKIKEIDFSALPENKDFLNINSRIEVEKENFPSISEYKENNLPF